MARSPALPPGGRVRSPSFERQWFEQVARAAQRWGIGPERFFDEVGERLEKGAREYGEHSWRAKTLPELLKEIGEEGADVAGWGVLAAQLVNHEAGEELIGQEASAEIQTHLVRGAALALLLNEEMREARQAYAVARAEAEWRRKVPAGPPG